MPKPIADAYARHPVKFTLGAIINVGGILALVAGLFLAL
jgi:hypothetical protein